METGEDIIRQRLPSYLVPSLPTTYTFELTAQCNHRCIGCGNVFSHQPQHLSLEQFKTLIARLPQPPAALRLTGGEVTLHPEFFELVEWIDPLGIPYVIFTNGNWRDPRALVERLSRCQNLNGLLVSLHGDQPSVQRAFTRVDSFEQVCANIRLAVQAGLRIGTNTLLLKSTHDRIPQMVQLGQDLGVRSIHFSRYYGPGLPGLELSAPELAEAVKRIAQIHQENPNVRFNNCIPACFIETGGPAIRGCTSGFTHATIDPRGNVRPCTHTPILLGNLFEQEMSAIWDSAELWAWRARIPAACFDCARFNACRGGCRATAYQQGLSQDPLIQPDSPACKKVTPRLIELNPRACPATNFQIYRDGAQIYLVNRSEQFPVRENALPVLQALDGQTSLAELQSRFGNGAVDFIGMLVVQGLVVIEPG